MIYGTDRSDNNSPYPLAKLVEEGASFCLFKATRPTSYDPDFNDSWQEAKKTEGLIRGAYTWFDPRYDGIDQCKNLLSRGINFSAPGCIKMPFVDVEDLVVFNEAAQIDTAASAQANQWVADNWQLALSRLNDLLNYGKQETGIDFGIYSYNGYMREYYHSHPFPDNPFWLSSIQATCPVRYDNSKPPLFWQDSYRWKGTDMDGNIFPGTQAELNQLANINS